MIKNTFCFESWLDPARLDNSDGIKKNTESEWMIRQHPIGDPIAGITITDGVKIIGRLIKHSYTKFGHSS